MNTGIFNNPDFFPTPVHVLDMMQIDCTNKIVLEPSAGKGDIVDYLFSHGAKDVVCYENNDTLQQILQHKCKIMGKDFLTAKSEDVSHVDLIVMNPPFSNAEKHIVHAFEIAPEGCEILTLCNLETISKSYRHERINAILRDYGNYENLGSCFDNAERKTSVEVALVKLYKPVVNDETKFEGFFMDEDEEEQQVDGIMPFNEVRALVNRYVGAMKIFSQLDLFKVQMEYILAPLGMREFFFTVGYDSKIKSKEDFSKHIQIVSWNYIFDKMNIRKYVTSGVMKDINKFVEQQRQIPFTMKNIYRMFDIIIQTKEQNFNKAIIEVIDKFTMHTHENRFAVEGWKTNSGHMLNEKFIIDYMVKPKWSSSSKVELSYNGNGERLEDLVKVLCVLTGFNFDSISSLSSYFSQFGGLETNRWYSWAFFEIKVFKKGTMHLKFQNKEDWYVLNKAYGHLKGFSLPEKFNPKASKKQTKNDETKTNAEENFQLELSYKIAS